MAEMSDQQVPTPSELRETRDATLAVVDSLRAYVTTMQGKDRLFTTALVVHVRKSLQRLEASINPARKPHKSISRRDPFRFSGWPDEVPVAFEVIYNATDEVLALLNWQHLCEGKSYLPEVSPAAKKGRVNRGDGRNRSTMTPPGPWPTLPESAIPQLTEAVFLLEKCCSPQSGQGGGVALPQSAESADTSRLFPGGVPDDTNMQDLVVQLDANKSRKPEERKSMYQIARTLFNETKECQPKTNRYLRQIRRLRKKGEIIL
jgi:hypothetical protein